MSHDRAWFSCDLEESCCSTMTMALPSHSEELCFSRDVFLDKSFQVDEFVSQCRKQVTIERLREDLDSYFRTLKNAMVELINKDYADFVNLSANLVDMDKSITNLMKPLGELQGEIMAVKQAMEKSIDLTESRLATWTDIREQKAVLHRVISILESVDKLERLLKIIAPSDAGSASLEMDRLTEREEFSSMVMERVASEFNKLQYNASLTNNHPLVEDTKSRIAVITSTLQSHLERSFKAGLEKRDRETLTRCLQTYASINQQAAAEDMFRNVIVYPYMAKVISAKALLTHPQGLVGIFSEVLQFIPKHCSLLLEITSTGRGLSGYDFVVSAVWPAVVAVLEEKASVIFAPGNPDTFHKNYCASMEFLSSFEKQCLSQSSVKRLRTHPSFTSFMSKWSLPVYFQIRFQEIAGSLEGCLTLPLQLLPSKKDMPPHTPPFRLALFHTMWEAIHKCWAEGVYINMLVHRFWKLTLQLITRLALWLDEISVTAAAEVTSEERSGPATNKSVPLDVCLCIFSDCEELMREAPSIIDTIRPNISQNLVLLKNEPLLKESLSEATTQIHQLLPKYADIIVDRVVKSCIQNLEPAHTIPRLYRRTNRDVPTKPSSYVNTVIKPLLGTSPKFPAILRKEWVERIVQRISDRYFEITSELLTSVKRTEDSLLKLKSYRKSLVPASSGGLSDDNKIRLQLALDIEQYASQIVTVHPEALEILKVQELLGMGQSAKTAASSSAS